LPVAAQYAIGSYAQKVNFAKWHDTGSVHATLGPRSPFVLNASNNRSQRILHLVKTLVQICGTFDLSNWMSSWY
tara:strand:+ start:14436 stop:14657 length:222 start_codon:yes stop_codon:yes gene_type:complete